MDIKTSIIILNWNTLNCLKKCVNSIKENTTNYEIVIVDNGSNEYGTKEYIKSVTNKYIFNKENKGFSIGNNQGAKISTGEFICFVNSDVVVGNNWLNDMLDIFKKDTKCGSVGPLGNPRYGEIDGTIFSFSQYKGMYLNDVKTNRLVGFCILMKKELFDEIGWCEEFKVGNYEDNYLCEVIKSKGYNLWISSNSNVNHLNPGTTFKKNKIKYLETSNSNGLIFNKKMREIYE